MNMKPPHKRKQGLTLCKAVGLLDSEEDVPQEKILDAWALLIKTRMAWNMSKNYADYADDLVNSGAIDRDGVINHELINQINNQEERNERTQDNRAPGEETAGTTEAANVE